MSSFSEQYPAKREIDYPINQVGCSFSFFSRTQDDSLKCKSVLQQQGIFCLLHISKNKGGKNSNLFGSKQLHLVHI